MCLFPRSRARAQKLQRAVDTVLKRLPYKACTRLRYWGGKYRVIVCDLAEVNSADCETRLQQDAEVQSWLEQGESLFMSHEL